ncbi:MAG: hypothetical protein EA366_03465 [Spirulina sp. DLM2.Bin59]|nr:MAG: hypothetical protein EA366_03465 [Spirulina sp. DLM2.Bin59]
MIAFLLLIQGIFSVYLFMLNIIPAFAQSPASEDLECDEHGDCYRDELDPDKPHIISPRRSVILSDRPLVRWYAVEGETRYIVKIQGPNQLTWEQETSEPFILYDGPELVRGQTYRIEVSTYNGNHQDQTSFIWLTSATEQQINTAIAELDQTLSPLQKTLAIVEIYKAERLFNDAIDLLEAHLAEFGKTTAIDDSLSDLYRQIGLNQQTRWDQEQQP